MSFALGVVLVAVLDVVAIGALAVVSALPFRLDRRAGAVESFVLPFAPELEPDLVEGRTAA